MQRELIIHFISIAPSTNVDKKVVFHLIGSIRHIRRFGNAVSVLPPLFSTKPMRRILFLVLAVSFFTGQTSFSEVHWTVADNIQDVITDHSTLIDGVYHLNKDVYSATDTAAASTGARWTTNNPFTGNLAVGNSRLNVEGSTAFNFGLMVDGAFSLSDAGALNTAGMNGGTGLGVNGDFTATDATIMALGYGAYRSLSGDSFGRGISLRDGDFRMTGGTLDVIGSNFGEGITLEKGSFFQTDVGVTARSLANGVGNTGQGITLKSGDYTMVGGSLGTFAELGDTALILNGGSFTATDATILTFGDGFDDFGGPDESFSAGIWLEKGSFQMNGGTMEARGTDYGEGITLDNGNFVQNGGIVQTNGLLGLVGKAGQGVYLKNGNYEIMNGTLNAYAEYAGAGVMINVGNFIADNATITAWGDGYNDLGTPDEDYSQSIFLENGDFRMTGGTLDAQGSDYGEGITLKNGNFIQNGGHVTTTGTMGKLGLYGQGIIVENGNYELTDGVLDARSSGNGLGLEINNGNFVVNNGTVSAEVRNNWGESLAIYVDKHFDMRSGTLLLMPGDGTGYAVFAETASFGPDSVLRLDMNNDGTLGHLRTYLDTEISDGAKLELGMFDSVTLAKNRKVGGVFLRSNVSGITGTFDAPESTLTLNVVAEKIQADRQYRLTVERTAYASDFLDGNNRSVVESMERNLPAVIDSPNARPLVDIYNTMDRAETVSEIADAARGLTPWQATMFAGMLVNTTDSDQFDLSRNLDALRRQRTTGCDPCTALDGCGTKNPWETWFSGHGNFARYDAVSNSYSDLVLNAWGLRVGLGRKVNGFGRNTVFGAAFDYTHGNIGGDRTDSEFDSYGFLAAIRTDLRRKLWGELVAGYSYARFDQGRYDSLNTRHDSNIDDHLFRLGLSLGRDFHRGSRRLTPIAGLDYTLVHQKGYTESNPNGLGLNVGGDDLNSLRFRLGGEVEWRRGALSLAAHGFYRYEFLDRYASLDTWFSDALEVRFASCGQNISRSSGVLGGRLDWTLSKRTTVGVSYDFTVGDRYDEHWVNLGLRRTW